MAPVDVRKDVTTGVVTAAIAGTVVVIAEATAVRTTATDHSIFTNLILTFRRTESCL